MKRYFLLLVIFLFAYPLVAQTPDPFPPLDKARNLFEHEQQLRDWRERFPKARGWKWAARQEYELLKRADFDELATKLGIPVKSSERVYTKFVKKQTAMLELIGQSFLSNTMKEEYVALLVNNIEKLK